MQQDLALVTGATSGLGKALATLLAKRGYSLLLTGRSQEELLSFERELSSYTSVQILQLDLINPDPLLTLIEELAPDLVINAAGFGLYGDVLSHPIEKQMELLLVNGNAPIAISIAAARALQKQGKKGTILNISSMASGFIYPGFALYAAAKTLIKEFSQSFHAEVHKDGINVLVSLPGRFYSNFMARASNNEHTTSSFWVMSLEKTSQKLWKQIETKKTITVIDFRYQILALVAKVIPKTFLAKILRKK